MLPGLLFIGLACRALMPVGYMPAPLAGGLPFVLCPGSAFGAALMAAGHPMPAGEERAGGTHDHGTRPDARVFCPFAVLLGSSALPGDPEPVVPSIERVFPRTHAPAILEFALARVHRARSPPAV